MVGRLTHVVCDLAPIAGVCNMSKPATPRSTLKARYVFSVAAAPIADGWVAVEGERIVGLGQGPAPLPAEELGNVALLPGLVNAHTHLEFSHLSQPLGEPGTGLVDWIRQVIESFRRDKCPPPEAVAQGLHESVQAGTTTLGEIAQPGSSVGLFQNAPLETTVFLELIAPTPQRAVSLLPLARQHVQRSDPESRCQPGLSPHAPYSVVPELFEAAVSLSAAARVPLAFHLAESPEELLLLRKQQGPFANGWKELGTCDPALFSAGQGARHYLRKLAEAHRALVIHGNYLDGEEIGLLARHRRHMAVVYCPRTHAYFAHARYPLEEMLAAGVTVALGTDSRASSPDLSVLAEMRAVAQWFPALPGRVVLALGTLNGAAALGRGDQLGSLEAGKQANLVAVALPDHEADDPHQLLLESDLPVVASWYRGQRVLDGGKASP